MSIVFVFAATKMESGIIARMMRAKTHLPSQKAITIGEIGSNQIALVTTGMGPRNARAAARRVFHPSDSLPREVRDELPFPDATIIGGLAGSLVTWIGEGDVLLYESCLSATKPERRIGCSSQMVESMARSLGLNRLASKRCIGISTDRIAQRDRDRERLAESGATVVDMETFEVAACSAAAGVPVAVIRSVSDSPGSRMPDLNRALNSGGEFNRWALAPILAASPVATLRLFRASRRAIAALERALEAVLGTCPLVDVAGFPAGQEAEHCRIQQ
jgi:nucleoside phosphorylase